MRDDSWKIADFGLTTKGTTSSLITTRYSRGTAGYRPPELIRDDKPRYTNKVDIWAMGCIMYEIVVREPAFKEDYTLRHYMLQFSRLGSRLTLPVNVDVFWNENRDSFIQEAMDEMLEIEASLRPTALQIHDRFRSLAKQNTVSDRSAVEASISDKPSIPVMATSVEVQTSGYFVSIDFGTTYTGVAVAPSIYKDEPLGTCVNIVEVVKNWPGFAFSHAEKTPSLLEYNEKQEYVAWGGQVKAARPLSVANFKLGLQEIFEVSIDGTDKSAVGGLHGRQDWRHPKFPHKQAVDYVADYLKLLMKHVLLNGVLPNFPIPAHMITSYSITVPVFWADGAVDLTRRAAARAGLPEKDISVISESEAAACFSATFYEECGLSTGDLFLVCVAGGSTVVRFSLEDC
jgi:hypothetical protein